MKSMTYRGMLITAHAVEVGGGSTGFQYRYRGEIERDDAAGSKAAEFEPPLGRYFANAGAAIEHCLADGRALADALDTNSAVSAHAGAGPQERVPRSEDP